MSSPDQINISFRQLDTDYHINLVQGKKSEYFVEINGVTYAVLGDGDKLKTACEILNSIPLRGISNSEDLKGRLSSLSGISFPFYKTNEIGVDSLHTRSIAEEGIDISKTRIALDQEKKRDTIDFIAKAMREKYVFLERGNECADYLLKQLQMGSYDKIKDPETFAKALTEDLYKITQDKHIRIDFLTKSNQLESVEEPLETYTAEEIKDFHPDLDKVKTYTAEKSIGWMGGFNSPHEYQSGFLKDTNIGYFELAKFGVCNDEETHLSNFKIKKSSDLTEDVKARRAAFIDGIQHLKGAEAIIIDMRPNSGGDPSAVQLLCSLFMEEDISLNRIEWRTADGFKSDDFKTLSKEELPYSLRLITTPLYILGGPQTFSAGEEFMNDMKVHGRATIVGTSTAGGANPGGMHQVNELFEIFIPSGRAVNPIQEGNWEGIGITPDHLSKEEEALRTAIELIKSSQKLT